MAPKFTLIIPHKITALNNDAMGLNIRMLMENTVYPFELIIDTEAPKDPYKIWNEAARVARGEFLVFSNTDVLMAPDWDQYFIEYCEPNSIVVEYLVEPGNIGVASENIYKDFGRAPKSFRRDEFEDFALRRNAFPELKEERGWYMPCCVRKDWFLSTGGFPTELGFPNPNDILFWNRCRDQLGTKFLRVNSFAYHFQNLSGR